MQPTDFDGEVLCEDDWQTMSLRAQAKRQAKCPHDAEPKIQSLGGGLTVRLCPKCGAIR